MRAFTTAPFAFVNIATPLFPSFITLTAVNPPGISLLSAKAAAALLVVLAVIALGLTIRLLSPPREIPPTLPPLLAWLGAGILAAALGFDPTAGLVFIGIFAGGIVWHASLLRFYDEPGIAHAVIWSLLIACCAASTSAIVMAAAHWPTAQYVIGHSRAIGTFVLPGELAGYLVVLLPIAYGVAATTRNTALRVIAAVAILSGGMALLLTFSRAGWMGLAAAVAFVVAFRARALRAGAVAATGVVIVGLAVVLLLFNAHHNPSENYTRISIWQAALQIIDRFPLTGVGPFEFSHLYAIVRLPDGEPVAFHAHSVYFTFLAETGIVGVAAGVWAWWRFAAELRRRLSMARPESSMFALCVTAGLVGTLVQGLIDTVSVVIFALWLPTMALALVAARSGLVESET